MIRIGNKKKHYLTFLAGIIIIGGFISTYLPYSITVERKIYIHAGGNAIEKEIINLKTYALWYPWLISGYNISAVYSDTSRGEGAWVKWTNTDNDNKGTYLYKITKISSDSLIGFNLNLPNATSLDGNYTLNSNFTDNRTMVTWRIYLKNSEGGWLGAILSPKKRMLGEAMEAGLINLKILAEQATKYHGLQIEEIPQKGTFVATITDTVVRDKMFELMPIILRRIKDVLAKRQIKIIGKPLAQMQNIGKNKILLNLGFPVDQNGLPSGGVNILRMPQGYVLSAKYTGEYKNVAIAYSALSQYARDHGKASPAPPWEEYVNGTLPKSDTDSCNMIVYYPVYR